ncbi:WXG100 family type VII secretion target [Actinoplanes sp. L3-i22]|uniref:WXG100 family type VII secretion target n=1 Tax=Actinoplanes sp. L3-i22 TaxID=2836373 RepID=UPI001C77335D|nr:WXG100 family type VII secretion target [Actinoplanes sp. L3-i22]BCY07231.1 hypothetical protein L3i22_023190 [Actinoplanes sp. L3-i22]
MAQSQVTTTQAGMQSAGQEFVNKSGDFNGSLKSIDTEIGTLATHWTGTASTNFQNAMASWRSSFAAVISELDHMAEVMGATRVGYGAAEDNATARVGQFGDGLPHF